LTGRIGKLVARRAPNGRFAQNAVKAGFSPGDGPWLSIWGAFAGPAWLDSGAVLRSGNSSGSRAIGADQLARIFPSIVNNFFFSSLQNWPMLTPSGGIRA
jgi:hypothetical protein